MNEPDYEDMQRSIDEEREERQLHRMDRIYGRPPCPAGLAIWHATTGVPCMHRPGRETR